MIRATSTTTAAVEAMKVIGGTILGLAILGTVLVLARGWPDRGASTEEQRRTRHAICEVLDTLGADSTSRADVEACTFEEGS